MKKKKLKINVHRPVGSRVKYDDEGNVIPPLAALGDTESRDDVLQPEKGYLGVLSSSSLFYIFYLILVELSKLPIACYIL